MALRRLFIQSYILLSRVSFTQIPSGIEGGGERVIAIDLIYLPKELTVSKGLADDQSNVKESSILSQRIVRSPCLFPRWTRSVVELSIDYIWLMVQVLASCDNNHMVETWFYFCVMAENRTTQPHWARNG